MQSKLQELFEEYKTLLNSLDKIGYIVGDSFEGQAVVCNSKLALLPQYEALADLRIVDMKEYRTNN